MGAFAQTDRCDVTAQRAHSIRGNEFTVRTNSAFDVGTFTVTVAKDTTFSKVFRLPATRLFVEATLSYDSHILGSDKHPDFANMGLIVSRTKRTNYAMALAHAEADIPFKAFGSEAIDYSTVTAWVKLIGRSMIVVYMRCRRL